MLASVFIPAVSAEEVNVYSGRQEALIKPLLDKFTSQTGIKVNLVTGSGDALISRMQAEGELSPADLIIMADAGRLVRANQLGLLQDINSDEILRHIPASLRADDNHWIALTKRARPIMYVKGKTDPYSISSIADLTDARFAKQICIRSSGNIYNQSMIASLIILDGEQQTLEWAKGIVNNLARSPKGGDRDQINAMVAGECSIAIANTYYLGGMLTSDDPATRAVAQQVGVIWPDQDANGTHINISGAGITKYAPHKAQAQALLSFMLEQESQQWYAEVNHEYPIIEGVKWSDELASFGQFDAQKVDLETMGALNDEALRLMDKAGWR
ncbi:Fe(3+) ABC transporter substrate-binding protein [Glaciecola sp. SC05]|uniref:Fe(3+) ABC transporter substrate-binding protein n=1 Tax=Glaciecola sp. SC05 TaxID=1987355 RepID=UPI0035295AEC